MRLALRLPHIRTSSLSYPHTPITAPPIIQHIKRRQPAFSVPADVDDIDAADRAEPLACVDYVEDQYRHYREKECRPGYVDDKGMVVLGV